MQDNSSNLSSISDVLLIPFIKTEIFLDELCSRYNHSVFIIVGGRGGVAPKLSRFF